MYVNAYVYLKQEQNMMPQGFTERHKERRENLTVRLSEKTSEDMGIFKQENYRKHQGANI